MKYLFRYTSAENLKITEAVIEGESFQSCVDHFFFFIFTYTNTPPPLTVHTVKKVT